MISPADLEKVEFSVSFRGYNGDQVDDYIDMVVKEFTELTNEYEKYKDLCAKQNEQIKIMRERIVELENSKALSSNSFDYVAAEPETVVKTVVKTVVDTKINEEALKKAKALEKLTSEFKEKALELYKTQLSELEAMCFNYEPEDYSVNAEILPNVQEEPALFETVVESTEQEPVEEVTEEPFSDSTAPATAENGQDGATEETETADESLNDDEDTILSKDEIQALRECTNDDINAILDELNGLFKNEETKAQNAESQDINFENASVSPKMIQQNFDSLFITNVDDSE